VRDVLKAKLHCALLYDVSAGLVSLTALDLDCTQSISFPVVFVFPKNDVIPLRQKTQQC